MSGSSPEQSLTSTIAGPQVIGHHNISATSISSTRSEGAACIAESPIAGALSPHQRLSLASASSTPSSPQLPSRGSSGKLQRGVKKFLRLPQTPNTVHHHPTLHEDPLEQSVSSKEALFVRMLKGSRRIRGFRRSKRRGIDKPYHSDDGYTSDPGPPGEEEDEETDGDVDENRRQQQMRNLERKIEKLRSSLHEDDDGHGSEQDLAILPGIDEDKHHEDKHHRLRLLRPSLKNSKRKKLENWERELRMLQEGGAPLELSRYAALRGKIGGGLRGMSLGLRGRLTFKRSKRFSGGSVEDVIDDDEDDEVLDDDISQATEGVIHMETEEFTNETELVQFKEEMDVVRHTAEKALQENQNLREELETHKTQLQGLEQCINTIYHKLELEKERSERLEGQVNDITELHQHEVGELRTQIGQMEGMSMSKSQDLEDAMEACQAKLERLDVFVHRLIDDNGDVPASTIRKPVTTFISMVLVVLTLFIKLGGFVKTKTGLIVTAIVLFLAFIVYHFMYR